MCKAFFVRHSCDHCSAPRVERCPSKTRFGACKGVKRVEVKSPTPCSACRDRVSSSSNAPVQVQPRRLPPPDAATNVLAKEIEGMAGKKVRKTYDWMKNAEKRALPKPPKTLTDPGQIQTHQPKLPKAEPANAAAEKAIPTSTSITPDDHVLTTSTKADGKRARQADARARNAAKKRDFHDALEEEEDDHRPGKSAPTKKRKGIGAQPTTTTAAPPAPSTLPNPPPSVKKPRKKAPPKSLTLADSNIKPRKTTTHLPSSPTPTPKTKTITALTKHNHALESKLRSFGYSPTLLLDASLFSPASLASVHRALKPPPGLRRSPRLTPEARAEVFLSELGRQMSRTLVKSPPRGEKGKGDVVSPDVEEVAEFERAMMAGQSPSPSSRVPGSAAGNGNGSGDGLFASSEESEEE